MNTDSPCRDKNALPARNDRERRTKRTVADDPIEPPNAMTPGRLTLRLLGPPETLREGARFDAFGTLKTAALLYYLAATRRPHTRDHLATLFWGEMPDDNAKRNLTKSLQVLRKHFSPWLNIETQTVALAPDAAIDVDLLAFDHPPSAPHDLGALEAQIALYRGDTLDGVMLRDSPDFETWLVGERERLRDLLLRRLDQAVDLRLAAGDATRAMEHANRLLGLDPWRESAHRQMMTLLAHVGQRNAALAQYEQCRRALADELGVAPSAETTALYERLKRAGETIPNNLSAVSTRFVGRVAELAGIDAHLRDPACRLLTLVGSGGIGKTRLALQAALKFAQPRDESAPFPDGVFFVNLAPSQASDAGAAESAILRAIAETLYLFRKSSDDTPTRLREHLAQRQLLLVLDNFEGLIAGTTTLTSLLQSSPNLKLLVTSRERLNLREEWVSEIMGLTDETARELFALLAAQMRGTELTAADQPHVATICALTQNTPLALELAAGWLRVLSCEDVAAEIAVSLDFLTTHLRDVPERHRSLRAVFEYSWRMLPDRERDAFQRLSIFRGVFSREAALAVAGAPLPVLATLTDKSMIRLKVDGRYATHELLRQYGEELLQASPDLELRTRDLHCEYYTGRMASLTPQLRNEQRQALAMDEIEIDQDNFRAAWGWASQHRQAERIAGALESIGTYIDMRGGFDEGKASLGHTIDAFQDASRPSEFRLLVRLLGWQASFMLELEERSAADAALARAEGLLNRADQSGEGAASEKGMLLYWRAMLIRPTDRAAALALCKQSLAHLQAGNDAWWLHRVETLRAALLDPGL